MNEADTLLFFFISLIPIFATIFGAFVFCKLFYEATIRELFLKEIDEDEDNQNEH